MCNVRPGVAGFWSVKRLQGSASGCIGEGQARCKIMPRFMQMSIGISFYDLENSSWLFGLALQSFRGHAIWDPSAIRPCRTVATDRSGSADLEMPSMELQEEAQYPYAQMRF